MSAKMVPICQCQIGPWEERERGGLAHVRQMSQAPARVRLLEKFDSSPALSSAFCTGRVYCY
jgi:hypothetical protein